jgi:hypothetical protein
LHIYVDLNEMEKHGGWSGVNVLTFNITRSKSTKYPTMLEIASNI